MFRRPLRRSLRRFPLGMIPPAWQRANQLMTSGQYAEAASIYEQFASLRLDEVEWADEMTAECPYCGSAVRAQE